MLFDANSITFLFFCFLFELSRAFVIKVCCICVLRGSYEEMACCPEIGAISCRIPKLDMLFLSQTSNSTSLMWDTILDITVLDSNWYFNTDTANCR